MLFNIGGKQFINRLAYFSSRSGPFGCYKVPYAYFGGYKVPYAYFVTLSPYFGCYKVPSYTFPAVLLYWFDF